MLIELNKANDFDYMRTTKEWNNLSTNAKQLYMVLERYYKEGITKENVTAEQLAKDTKVDIKELNAVKKELVELGLYSWERGRLVVYTVVPNDHPMVDAFCEYYEQYYGVMHNQIDNPERYEAIINSRLTADNLKDVAYKVFESKEEPIGIQYFCTGNVIAGALQKIEKPKTKENLSVIDKQWNEVNEKHKAENDYWQQPEKVCQEDIVESDDVNDDEKINDIITAYNKAWRGEKHQGKDIKGEVKQKILDLLNRYSITDFKNVFVTSWWEFGMTEFALDFDWYFEENNFEDALEHAVPCGFVIDEE